MAEKEKNSIKIIIKMFNSKKETSINNFSCCSCLKLEQKTEERSKARHSVEY